MATNRRKKYKRLFLILAGSLLLLLPVYAFFIEPNWIAVTRIDINLSRLPAEFDGLTIAQISDLHYDHPGDARLIRRTVRMVNRLQPDVIVITGDFMTGNAAYVRPCVILLRGLHAPLGVFASPGNHDYNAIDLLRTELARAGIPLLLNANRPLRHGSVRLWIAGLDDAWYGYPDLKPTLRGIPARDPVILLAHEPDIADDIAPSSVDLQLSGHSHGGQVYLPMLGIERYPYQATKYPRGLYHIGHLQLYTNRGIGALLSVRLNSRPEITLLTLKAGNRN